MSVAPCPACGIKHIRFPRRCVEDARADYTHVVIANLASLGNSTQKEFAIKAEEAWRAMETYCAEMGWPDAKKEDA